MSDQEMQFADPEWQPPRQGHSTREQASYIPVDANNSPRQQSDGQATVHDRDEATDYTRGYRAEQPGYRFAQARSARRPRRKRSPWFWVILVAIILAILGFTPFGEDSIFQFWDVLVAIVIPAGITALIIIGISLARNRSSSSEIRTFLVSTQPRIIIKNQVGTIRVHPGSAEDRVTIQANKHARGWAHSDIAVNYDQNVVKNRITVKAGQKWSFLHPQSLDFDVTVPRMVDLDLKTDAGSINISDISGQVVCINDAGSIKVNGAHLRGDSQLKTDAGVVTFTGSLDPIGSYRMTTDAGNVTVLLPENVSFRLDAKTDVGSINSDFPLNVQRVFPGGKAHGDIGMPPYPSLKLRTDVGSISLRRASTL